MTYGREDRVQELKQESLKPQGDFFFFQLYLILKPVLSPEKLIRDCLVARET